LATIRDVAKRASVSVSTASRILSNSTKEKYAEDTQVRVLRASVELGYRPNFAARALVSGNTRIVAAVFPRVYGDTPFTALASLQTLSGIEAYCSENGYHLLLSSPHIVEGQVDASFTNLLAGGYPTGIIIDSHFDIEPVMDVVKGFQVPTVVLGYYPYPHYLRSDNFVGGSLMMEHLLDLGHCHIGIIGLHEGVSEAAAQRLSGLKAACQARGVDYDSLPYVNGTFSADSGAAAARELLTKCPHITAIAAINDRMAMGAIRQLQDMGYRVPDQISVIGHDNLPQTNEFNPPLTTINTELSTWGGMAMDMLVELINGEQPEPIILQPRLKIRKSTASCGDRGSD